MNILCKSTNLSPRRLRECLYSLAMAIMSSMHASMLRLVYKAEISALQKFLFSRSTGFNDDNLSKCSWVLLRCVGTWLSNGVSMCVTNHANFSVGLPQHDTMGRTLQCCKISTLLVISLTSNFGLLRSFCSLGEHLKSLEQKLIFLKRCNQTNVIP